MSGNRAIRLGVSSCLLGEAVRYDGGHKRDRFVADVLGEHVEWVPVCPEFEAGLGLPRPPMHLVRDGNGVRMLEIASGRDHTRTLQRYAARRVRALRDLDLCGYVLKQGSPSCGMAQVEVFRPRGSPQRKGTGLFARALRESLPDLPVEQEGRLQDPRLRENFIERVFAYRRLRDLFTGRWSHGQVVAFHAAHELQLMAHSTTLCRELGSLVARGRRTPRAALRTRYQTRFMAGLSLPASRVRNASVLRHAAGDLKHHLEGAAQRELVERIRDYRKGLIPLVVPITLLRHHAEVQGLARLDGQSFLRPHPKELLLRNHV